MRQTYPIIPLPYDIRGKSVIRMLISELAVSGFITMN